MRPGPGGRALHFSFATVLALSGVGCSHIEKVTYTSAPAPMVSPTTAPVARIFLVGDAGNELKVAFDRDVRPRLDRAAQVAANPAATADRYRVLLDSARNDVTAPPRRLDDLEAAAVSKLSAATNLDDRSAAADRLRRELHWLLAELPPLTPVLEALATDLRDVSSHDTLIYLGDNVYPIGVDPLAKLHPAIGPEGLNADASELALDYFALRQQLKLATEADVGVLVPGNHDWGCRRQCEPDALERVRAQKSIVDGLNYPTVRLLPTPGCVGPETIEIAPLAGRIRVIAIDTQVLLQPGLAAACPVSPADALARLARVMALGGRTVVVAHHPLLTFGPHGGYAKRKGDRALAAAGLLFRYRSQQDTWSADYKRMVSQLKTALAAAPDSASVLFAAGHDHSLQVMRQAPLGHWLVVSGAGSKTSPVAPGPGPGPDWARSRPGYAVLEFYPDDRVLLRSRSHDGDCWRDRYLDVTR